MNRASRIGLYTGLVLLGSWSVAEAQTAGTGSAATAARRPSASSYYSRTATTAGRGTACASSRASGPGMSAVENDPLRPYSAQGRQSAEMVSTTRPSQAPPPPPRVQPQARRNYFPGMQNGLHRNGNVPQSRHHCVPSRSSVLGGSLGGGR
jgi:hypothetical protein